jgi:hypothetical protein
MGYFPLPWLHQQLSAPGATDTTCYCHLEQLLAFLNLPGSVLQWLPLRAMTLKHALAVSFFYKAVAIQAAEDMLSFNPLLAVDSKGVQQRWAAFLVTRTDTTCSELLVRAVRISLPNCKDVTDRFTGQVESAEALPLKALHTQLRDYGSSWDGWGFYITDVMTVSAVRSTGMSSMVVGGDSPPSGVGVWEPVPWAQHACAALETCDAAVSPAHPVLGGPLADAVLEATRGLGFGVGTLKACFLSRSIISVIAWVLSW